MSVLFTLLEKLDYEVLRGNPGIEVTGIFDNSSKVTKGGLFVCISGFRADGHRFINEAVKNGAKAVVIEKDLDEETVRTLKVENITVIRVKDTRYALAFIAAAWYANPADSLKIIGITGTKGKTTTTYMVKSMLENAGYKVGLIGTIEIIIGDEHIPSVNTTPDALSLQGILRKMADKGIEVVVMEAASQGLKLHRMQGFTFDLGVFTNLEPDHIGPNEHASMEEYIYCKGLLFKQCRQGIVNADDAHVLKVLEGHTCNIETYGFNEGADLSAYNLMLLKSTGELGIEFDLRGDIEDHFIVPTPGRFSVYNALCAIAVAKHFNIKSENIKKALLDTKVKGRIEMVKTPWPYTVIIDYAHNALSLESLLTSLREYKPRRLVTLFGCGGNRTKERRYGMGEVSGRLSDLTIITSDNPRDEDPKAIMEDIRGSVVKAGGKYVEFIDRKDAIRYALENGLRNDIIVLAGKGHEDYQIVKGIKYPLDERVIVKEIIEENSRKK